MIAFLIGFVTGRVVALRKTKMLQRQIDDLAQRNTVLQEDFGIDELFGGETQDQLDQFREQKDAILQGQAIDEAEFLSRAKELALKGADLQVIVQYDLRHLSRVTGKNYQI